MDFGHVPTDRDVSRRIVVTFGKSSRTAYLRDSLDLFDHE